MKEAQNLTIFGNVIGSELLAQGMPMPQVDVIRIISGDLANNARGKPAVGFHTVVLICSVIRIISGQRHDGGLVGGAVAVRGREA